MSYTKKKFAEKAYAVLGYAEYIFDIMPEEIMAGVDQLDNMMAEWNSMGIQIGYPIVTDTDDTIYQDKTNVPVRFNNAVIYQLAIRLAPGLGKTLSPTSMMIANNAYQAMLTALVTPHSLQYPINTPAGAGNKPWRRVYSPFLPAPCPDIDVDGGNELEFD